MSVETSYLSCYGKLVFITVFDNHKWKGKSFKVKETTRLGVCYFHLNTFRKLTTFSTDCSIFGKYFSNK